MYKIIGSDQRIYGPVSAAQILQWQAQGRVNGATLAQREGAYDWRPLSSYPELAGPILMPPPIACQNGSGFATASLVCGVVSNVCCCFGIVTSVLGIVFAVLALRQAETDPRRLGRGAAIAGLVLSIIGLSWHSLLPLFIPAMIPHFHHFVRHW